MSATNEAKAVREVSIVTRNGSFMAPTSSSSFLTGVFFGELEASLSLKRFSASLSNHCIVFWSGGVLLVKFVGAGLDDVDD